MDKKLLKYFKGDDLAASVWLQKYALEGEKTPDDMHRRLAKEFARIEKKYKNSLSEEEIFLLLKDFHYVVPGGSIMSGLGSKEYISLSNCTVITPPDDTYESIMDSRKAIVQLSKRRCGVGIDISKLRPKYTKVSNSAKTSTGAVSFMQGYSDIANEVAQGGRRSALMITMDINHPDIEDFIMAKQDLTKVTGANISVMVNDEFMKAVENNTNYILRFPIDYDVTQLPESSEYNVLKEIYCVNTDSVKCYYKRIKAKELWDKLMFCAWNTAEPGIVFKDTINKYSPDSIYPEFKMVGLNPCAEQALGPEDSCRLLHLNLTSFVKNPFTEKSFFDYDLFEDIVFAAVRLGDDIVDLEIEYIDRILSKIKKEDGESSEYKMWQKFKDTGFKGRRIGLGFTGLADVLAMLNLKYGDADSIKVVNSIMKKKFITEIKSSIQLAKERGSFPNYSKSLVEESKDNFWYTNLKDNYPLLYKDLLQYGIRNLSVSTVAPTGTVSLMTASSSGIEPVFMPYYSRKVKCNNDEKGDFVDKLGVHYKTHVVVHPRLKEWYCLENIHNKDSVDNLSIKDWQEIFEVSSYYNNTTQDIKWKDRVKMQSTIQQYISNAISSTVNLPKETTVEEIQDLYLTAWKSNLKGITLYRDTCRDGILTSVTDNTTKTLDKRNAPKRSKELEADFYTVKVKGEQFIVLVGLLENKPYEIFTFRPTDNINIDNHKGIITKVKKGKYSFDSQHINISDLQLANENIEENAATLYTSMLLRHGIDINYIVKTAKKVNENITSFSSAMCRILSKYLKDGETGELCSECNGKLIRTGGCLACPECGYSKCG